MSESEYPPPDRASEDERSDDETSTDESERPASEREAFANEAAPSEAFVDEAAPSEAFADEAADRSTSRNHRDSDIDASGNASSKNESDDTFEDSETLSPSVRRLVKQYDLDVTGIHGTGPSGRIRVGDVMAMLGNRATAPNDERQTLDSPIQQAPVTSIFECNVSRVLAHQKEMHEQRVEIGLPAYYMLACCSALKLVPELNRDPDRIDLAFVRESAGNAATSVIVRDAADLGIAEINRQFLARTEHTASQPDSEHLGDASFVIYDHGLSGSLIAFPTEIVAGHRASAGIGKIRRAVVVKNVGGQERARIAAQCHLSISVLPGTADVRRANQFLSEFVRVLETYNTAEIASAT